MPSTILCRQINQTFDSDQIIRGTKLTKHQRITQFPELIFRIGKSIICGNHDLACQIFPAWLTTPNKALSRARLSDGKEYHQAGIVAKTLKTIISRAKIEKKFTTSTINVPVQGDAFSTGISGISSVPSQFPVSPSHAAILQRVFSITDPVLEAGQPHQEDVPLRR